ncbi:MAG: response regulator [Acidobacteriota bacterium]
MSDDHPIIVFFDTDKEWLRFARETLVREPYQVVTANSNAALEKQLAELPPGRPALILLDEWSLFEDFHAILDLVSPRAFAVLFESSLETDRARSIFKEGAIDCAWKPYSDRDLVLAIEQAVARWRVSSSHAVAGSQKRLHGRILVVDDEDSWASYMVNFLPSEQSIEVAHTYASAKQKIDAISFDLVISDWRLDDSDEQNFQGFELMKYVRRLDARRGSYTSLIAVSAYGTEDKIRDAYRDLNINFYFSKQAISQFEYHDSVQEALLGAKRRTQSGLEPSEAGG